MTRLGCDRDSSYILMGTCGMQFIEPKLFKVK